MKILKNSKIIKYAIELEKGRQLLFGSIYSLRLIKLETLKTYIKTNLVTGFICFFKLFARILIFFNQKPYNHLQFCIGY